MEISAALWALEAQERTLLFLVFASYSTKVQNTICAIWLLGYEYFVNFSVY